MPRKLINFTKTSREEKEMILLWRNTQEIREWMHTKEPISLRDHLAFINSLSHTKTKEYFLLKIQELYLGVIDFTDINKHLGSADIGLYKNPDLKGVGEKLMESIVRYGFEKLELKTLYAMVYKTNKKAIKLYKKFGFSIKKETQELFKMELKYENWQV